MDVLQELKSSRLSDRILCALDLSIEQGDAGTAELLLKALEQSMTRNAGGGEFVERRSYPDELVEVQKRFVEMKAQCMALRAQG